MDTLQSLQGSSGCHVTCITLKGRYHVILEKNLFTYSCIYMSTKNSPKGILYTAFFYQEIWAVLKAYFKMPPVWVGFTSDVHGEQLLMYLEHLHAKACVK